MQNLSDAAVLEDLVGRLRRLPANQPCLWGTMNAQQMALHVGDASAAVLKQRPFAAKHRGGPAWLRRVVLLYLVPRMPRGIKSGANPAATVVDRATFAKDVERAIGLHQQLATAAPGTLVDAHPLFGPMTRAQWMRWVFLHTDHHLRQFDM